MSKIIIKESTLRHKIKECIKKYLYEKINNSKVNVRLLEMHGTYNGNRYIKLESNSKKCIYSSFLNEGVMFEPDENSKGGIITFSTDVNCNQLSDNKIVNKIKQFMATMKNRFTATSKIDKIASDHKLEGWTIGHYLNGRYKDFKTGQQFSENSLSLELIGIDTDTLIKIAEEICEVFKQQSVLVKDYSSMRIMFVEP